MNETNYHIHQNLIKGSISGNQKDQYALYELYVDAMYSVCFRMLGNTEDAEDVLQEGFMHAFANLTQFSFQSTFGAWLKRIVINHSLNFLRAKKISFVEMKESDTMISEDSPKEESNEVDYMDLQKVKSGIELLPDGYKQIIVLYLIEGYDHREIAEILQIAESTSKSQYARAKKKLIQIMKNL